MLEYDFYPDLLEHEFNADEALGFVDWAGDLNTFADGEWIPDLDGSIAHESGDNILDNSFPMEYNLNYDALNFHDTLQDHGMTAHSFPNIQEGPPVFSSNSSLKLIFHSKQYKD